MYRALAFKELREIAWIGGIILAAMILVILNQIGGAADPSRFLSFGLLPINPFAPHRIPFIHPTLVQNVAWVTVIGALALGFRQVLGESFRGTWLFLLHRPAPRASIVATKLGVGAGLLLATTALPLLAFAVWAALPGTHASPFDWRMTNGPLTLCCGATCVYFAAFLSALREARWYATRLFPLILAALIMVVVGFTVLWPVWWPITGWIVVIVVDAIYVTAILSTAKTREY